MNKLISNSHILFNKKNFKILLLAVGFIFIVSLASLYMRLLALDSYQVKQPVINPLAPKVVKIFLKYPDDILRELLSRNLTSVINTLNSENEFYAPKQEGKAALDALVKGDYSATKSLFIKASQKIGLNNKQIAELHRNLGTIAYLGLEKEGFSKSLSEAQQSYSRATQLEPDNINGWSNMGYLARRPIEVIKIKGDGNNETEYNYNSKGYDEAVNIYNHIIELAEKQNNYFELAWAYRDLAFLYDMRKNDEAYDFHKKNSSSNSWIVGDNEGYDNKILNFSNLALLIFEKLKLKDGIAEMHRKLGYLYIFSFNNYKPGIENYEKSLVLDEQLGNKEAMSITYGSLSVLYQGPMNDLEKAVDYAKKNLLLKKEIGNTNFLQEYSQLADYNERLGNLNESIFFYKKLLDESEQKGEASNIASYATSLGNIYIKLNELDNALTSYQKAFLIHEKSGNKEQIALSYNDLGNVYMNKGDKKQAEFAFKKSLEILKTMNNLSHLREVEDRLEAVSIK